jgi:hypothetical protein
MEDTVVRYASSGISMLFNQITHNNNLEQLIGAIDPLCTIIKLALLHYKESGTKISIKNNTVDIQDSWVLQGIQRWYNDDGRNQLHQLKLPIFYFRGIVLSFIIFDHLAFEEETLNYLNDLVVKGLKKMRITYDIDRKTGSLVKNCIDDYIKILTTPYHIDDYMIEMNKYNKPTIFAIYNEYTKLWHLDDIKIILDIFKLIENKEIPIIQNKLADSINHFVMAKDMTIDTIRSV